MPQAIIGALRVNLSMASAAFERGVKRSKSALQRLGAAARRVGQIIKAAMTAAAAAVAIAAGGMAVAIRKAVNEFDEIAKASRAVGTTVESLSQLRFAAELSAVSTEILNRGIRNYGRNALAGIKGTNDFTAAMDALGVQFRTADGGIRNFDAVLPQLADKFRELPNSAAKTALAMKIFGERVGPSFINLLNNGSAGLARLREEADALGTTISTSTAVQAEEFNDTISRVRRGLAGIVNQITAELLPDLQSLATGVLNNVRAFKEWIAVEPGMIGFVGKTTRIMSSLLDVFRAITISVKGVAAAMAALINLDFSKVKEAVANTFQDLENLGSGTVTKLREALTGVKSDVAAILQGDTGLGENQAPPVVRQFNQATDAINRFRAASTQGKAEAAALARANQRAADITRQAYHTAASGITNALASVFSENKGVAIATALINTFLGITKALSSAPPPLNFAQAAAVGAAGFAQVANIRNQTRRGGGSGGTSATGAVASGAGAPTGSALPTQLANITLVGDTFGRDQIVDLIANINDAVADGAVLRVS